MKLAAKKDLLTVIFYILCYISACHIVPFWWATLIFSFIPFFFFLIAEAN
jgi:hypothetical protein